MKLTIQKTALAQALSAVATIASDKGDRPVLKFAKLETGGSMLRLTGMSVDCSYMRFIPYGNNLPKEESCLLPIAKVREWLSRVGDGDINLEHDANGLKLSINDSGPSRFAAYPVSDFPQTPKLPEAVTLVADFAPLKHIAWSALETNAGRPMLEAVFIEHEDGGIVAATTDGRKVGVVKIAGEIRDKAFIMSPIALPSKYIGLVASFGKCSLLESKSDLHFTSDEFSIAIRKSEHGVPQWRKSIVNPEFPYIGSITVMREELAQSVNLCHLYRGSDIGFEHGVPVSIAKTTTGMNISCFVAKTSESHTRDIDGRVKGDFPTIRLSTEHIAPFFDLPDESPLKIEFTGDKTMVHMSAPDIGVDYYICPLFPEKKETA